MSMFASNGTIEKSYTAAPAAVGAAIAAVCTEAGHHLGTVSPDQTRFELTTKRTALNWGTAIVLTLSEAGANTNVRVDYDNSAGSQKALLDGRKNKKTVESFLGQLDARI
ncbi:hypothetical protein GCM10009592_28950 [Brachybacterium rhamnosum]|uniref:Uncharacterized protein n=1 Tax=Brachybacterium rhamnosum TaxID=173361 RepID=A0ABW4Q3V5_9MICO